MASPRDNPRPLLAVVRFMGHDKLIERLKSRVHTVTPEGCWLVRDSANGYGRTRILGVGYYTHRLAWVAYHDRDPQSGTSLDHLCGNRNCINPTHLEPVSHRTNALRGDGITAQFARRTHCKEGHELGGDNVFPSAGRRCRRCALDSDKRTKAAARNAVA